MTNSLLITESWVIDNIQKTYANQKNTLETLIHQCKYKIPTSVYEADLMAKKQKELQKELNDLQLSYVEIMRNSDHE